jgi:hypothetical protein
MTPLPSAAGSHDEQVVVEPTKGRQLGARPPGEDRAVHGEVRWCPAERLVQARGDDLQGARVQPVGAGGLQQAAGDRLSEGVHQPRGPRRIPDVHDVQVNAAMLRLRGGSAQRLQARQRLVHADEHPALSSLEHGSQRLRYVPARLDAQRRAIALRCGVGPEPATLVVHFSYHYFSRDFLKNAVIFVATARSRSAASPREGGQRP